MVAVHVAVMYVVWLKDPLGRDASTSPSHHSPFPNPHNALNQGGAWHLVKRVGSRTPRHERPELIPAQSLLLAPGLHPLAPAYSEYPRVTWPTTLLQGPAGSDTASGRAYLLTERYK